MSGLQVLAVEGKLFYTFDWSDVVPAMSPLVTISSVAYTLPSNTSPQELTTFDTSEDFGNYLSSVGLQGAVHGKTYQVQAAATLSNGEVVVKDITVRGFNG